MSTGPIQPQGLLALLTQQRDLYLKLRRLSDQQRSMISGDRPALLLEILHERHNLVAALAHLNESLSPFRRDWDANHAALPADERGQASALLREINGLLAGILRADQEDEALLAARKQAIAAELAATTGGRVANAAYARQAGGAHGPASADVTG
jgi:hypothetical protein